ncbi:MAG: hypothetical protein ACLFTT_01515 [Candidatus Hydrogenedentota bacterium]
MDGHWTYASPEESGSDLAQGDIIEIDTRLQKFLVGASIDENTFALLILTQSCDLLKRHGRPCNADFINVAPIKPLATELPKLLSRITRPVVENVFTTSDRQKIRQFLERLLNQNEQALGLFYLHPDTRKVINLAEPSVAYLRASSSLACDEELYDALIAKKLGGLEPSFQSKLGWLVGNLYSRVGTRDWEEEAVKDLIESYFEQFGCEWIENEKLKKAERHGINMEYLTVEKVRSIRSSEEYQPIPFRQELANEAEKEFSLIIERILDGLDYTSFVSASPETIPWQIAREFQSRLENASTKLRNRLVNNRAFARAQRRGN